MENEAVLKDSHYILPLPFRDPEVQLPNNRAQASTRAKWLAKKFQRNQKLLSDYQAFMDELLEKGYAVKIDAPAEEGKLPTILKSRERYELCLTVVQLTTVAVSTKKS